MNEEAALTMDELMTASQVAEALLIRESTVADYARRGLLPSIKLGRHRRFIRGDVEAALERLRSSGPTRPSTNSPLRQPYPI